VCHQYLIQDANDSDSDSSSSLTVPDTPPSLRKRILSKLRNTPVGTPLASDSAALSVSSVQQRQLFGEYIVRHIINFIYVVSFIIFWCNSAVLVGLASQRYWPTGFNPRQCCACLNFTKLGSTYFIRRLLRDCEPVHN